MPTLLRKLVPVAPSIPRDAVDDDNNVVYSFAMEYSGPPVTYDIPQVLPVDIEYIPTASPVLSASSLSNLSIPVIQPIQKHELKNFEKDFKLGLKGVDVSLCEGIDCKGCVNVKESHEPLLVTEWEDSRRVEGLYVEGLSCESSVFVDSSGVLSLISDDDTKPEFSDGIGSSGSFGYLASFNESHESLGRSNALGLLVTSLTEENCISTELTMSSRTFSSENSIRMENCADETPRDAGKLLAVRFRDPESSDIVSEEFDHVEGGIIQVRPQPVQRKGKKGSCYRCGKGNRFTEKECCLVCGAKFCGNCVLRAMGSMPEGRKCITCIGQPINESKRGSLGKSSWMLKRLLTEKGTKQIMKLELFSKANKLQPELVFVNDSPLCQEEIALLQNCSNPPKKLKPGHYWYDKVSGYWGKVGQKPCQIISPHLNISEPIKQNASNGNTNVLINNREITKAELMMLQYAGVECEGNPTFWMNADGSIKEEGMKNERGRIWDKTGMRLVCAMLSLPVPSEIVNIDEEEAANLLNREVLNHLDEKYLQKLLLVGFSKSGTSTIFKQAKLLYNVAFTEDERENIKFIIQSNLYSYLGILLEGRQRFEDEILIELRKGHTTDQSSSSEMIEMIDKIDEESIYSIGPRLKAFSDWLLQVKMSGNMESIFPAATREYAPIVEELWKNDAIQATYERINELKMLPRVASYFLSRAVEISRTEYEPSDTDILLSEGITLFNGPASVEFSFPKSVHDNSMFPAYNHYPSVHDSCMPPASHHYPSLRYELIRVHVSNLGGNYKWLNMFEDVGIVLFCVNLIDYDEFSDHGNGSLTNNMIETQKLFESMVTHPIFYDKDFLLILNKFDLFEEKIKQVPLNKCEWFREFNPVISHYSGGDTNTSSTNSSLAQNAFQYIAVKFKNLYRSLTGPESEHKLYVSLVNALEPDTVDKALRYGREILKWNDEKENFLCSDLSSYSLDASFSQFSK